MSTEVGSLCNGFADVEKYKRGVLGHPALKPKLSQLVLLEKCSKNTLKKRWMVLYIQKNMRLKEKRDLFMIVGTGVLSGY